MSKCNLAKQVGLEFGISTRSVYRAGKLVDALAFLGPEIEKKFIAGELSMKMIFALEKARSSRDKSTSQKRKVLDDVAVTKRKVRQLQKAV
jgi:hypothetical protein